jgi:2-octaprenylphenol hydroxylase
VSAPLHDVAIAGAGIAGAALAATLAPRGLDIVLLDGAPLPAPPPVPVGIESVDPRVSALNAASRALLEGCGAWARIPATARCAYTGMRVWEEDGTGAIGFEAGEIGAAELGHIVENRWIVHALLGALAAHGNVRVRGAARLQALELPRSPGEPVSVELACGDRLRARLLVGADGAQSAVRRLAGIDASLRDTGQQAIVATIRTAGLHAHTAWQRFLQTGPLALLPLAAPPEGHCCSIVWSADRAEAERLMALDDAAFAVALGRASEFCAGEVLGLTRRIAFPLRQLHAASYAGAALALVGDAAHVVHPLAGQGINLGLADVRVLDEEIGRALGRHADPGDAGALARYARRRRGENALMLEAMDGFRRLFGDRRVPVRLLRNAGVGAVHRAGPLKRLFMRHAMGLG